MCLLKIIKKEIHSLGLYLTCLVSSRGLVHEDEILNPASIGVIIVQDAISRITITPSSTRLLIEPLHTLWQRHVYDKAYIMFVNSHTERYCSADHLYFVIKPVSLRTSTLHISQSSVVRLTTDPHLV